MPLHHDPFSRALNDIRLRLRSGALVQGEQLRVASLAHDLRLSATPVREALSRLAGEGAIEDRRGAGYFAPRLDAQDLTDLYDLSWIYLNAAIPQGPDRSGGAREISRSSFGGPDGEGHLVAWTEALFERLVLRSHSAAMQRAHSLLADRLAPVRRVEPMVLPEVEHELVELEVLIDTAPAGLQAQLAAYHDRRRGAAAELIGALRSHAGSRPIR